jgi:disulfide oxidoreductase YuzD
MFCNECGTKNPDNAKFCNNCGANLVVGSTKDVKTVINDQKKSVEQKESIPGESKFDKCLEALKKNFSLILIFTVIICIGTLLLLIHFEFLIIDIFVVVIAVTYMLFIQPHNGKSPISNMKLSQIVTKAIVGALIMLIILFTIIELAGFILIIHNPQSAPVTIPLSTIPLVTTTFPTPAIPNSQHTTVATVAPSQTKHYELWGDCSALARRSMEIISDCQVYGDNDPRCDMNYVFALAKQMDKVCFYKELATYTNPNLNFKIDYPKEWGVPTVTQDKGYYLIGFKYANVQVINNINQTLDQWIKKWNDDELSKGKPQNLVQSHIIVDGIDAIKQVKEVTDQNGFSGSIIEVHSIFNNNLYVVSFLKPSGIDYSPNNYSVETMIDSFHFLK